MLRLIPRPAYRLALKIAFPVQQIVRRITGRARDGVSVIAQDRQGQILLIRHSYGPEGWYLPGGGMKRGEDPAEAARRELREETGCDAVELREITIFEEVLSGGSHAAHLYEALIEGEPTADGREVLQAQMFPADALPATLSPRTRQRLDLWRAGLEQR